MPVNQQLRSIAEVNRFVWDLLREGYQHFALEGDLGAGKTTLVQQAGALLGVKGPMQSPTFTLMAVYETPKAPLYHFDLYRLHSAEEALDSGLEAYWEQTNAYVFIEWPGIVASMLPDSFLWLQLTYQDADTRLITVKR